MYVVPARPEAETLDAIVTGAILVYRKLALALFDPGSTFSYKYAYYAPQLDLTSDLLSLPLHVSTPIGNSLVVD